MRKVIRKTVVFFAIMLAAIYCVIITGIFVLPDEINASSDKPINYMGIFTIKHSGDELVDYQSSTRVSVSVNDIKLFGVIPVKSASVSHKKEQSVYVSGESFGIKLYTDGVIVVGTKDVEADGKMCNPARAAGIEKGDIIVSVNDVKTNTSSQVEDILNDNNGKGYRIKIKRNGNYKNLMLEPVYSKKDGCFKVGLWVRDSTAGIGTITFYNPENNSLAALGHPITDVDTNDIMPILNGEAVKANVTKIYKSSNGETGSICCDFTNDTIGTLSINSISGVYGRLSSQEDRSKLYKVAAAQEAEKGEAQIICTIDDRGPRAYSVEITRVSYRDNEEKNMVIKVTDKELLDKTGGIVQGMSGSPIIQNGKLIGALTHVIVDNPQKGYAIFAERMLSESKNIK